MASYYEQVEKAIKINEQEIKHLQEELKGLRSVEKDTPRASYQRQEAQIMRHLQTEQSRLEGNKSLLRNYDLALSRLEKIDELRNKEKNGQTSDEEITTVENELNNSMNLLTDELRQEVRETFENRIQVSKKQVVDPQEIPEIEEINASPENHQTTTETSEEVKSEESIKTKRDKMAEEYKKAEEAYQESIKRMQDIFREELERRENEGPFKTEEELDNFNNYYMGLKLKENEKFIAVTKRLDIARKSLRLIDKKTNKSQLQNNPSTKQSLKQKTKKMIGYKPQEKKALPAKGESSYRKTEQQPEERLVVKSDVKSLMPTQKNLGTIVVPNSKALVPVQISEEQKSTSNAPKKVEVSKSSNDTITIPIARKIKPQKKEISTNNQEPPIWEQRIDFPTIIEEESVVEAPSFPVFPQEEINQILATNTKAEIKKEEFKQTKTESKNEEPKKTMNNQKESTPKRKNRIQIVEDIVYYYDLPIEGLQASNVEVSSHFKQEVKSGGCLYNIIRTVPGFVKAPFTALKKLGDRIMHSRHGARKMEQLSDRIQSQSLEDLEEANEVFTGKDSTEFPTAAKIMLGDAIKKKKEQDLDTHDQKLEKEYEKEVAAVEQVEAYDEALANPKISDQEKEEITKRKQIVSQQHPTSRDTIAQIKALGEVAQNPKASQQDKQGAIERRREILEEHFGEQVESSESSDKVSVEVPEVTIERLNKQIDDAFRRLGMSEEEIKKVHEDARKKAEEKARIILKGKKEITADDLLQKIDATLNKKTSASPLTGTGIKK